MRHIYARPSEMRTGYRTRIGKNCEVELFIMRGIAERRLKAER